MSANKFSRKNNQSVPLAKAYEQDRDTKSRQA